MKYCDYYLQGYALCRRLLLAPRGCRFGGLVPRFWYLGGPFWHLGSSLGDHFGSTGPAWTTMGAAGWTRGGPEHDFHRFWILR